MTGKSVRFTEVVERSGRPHAHTLWLPPERDPELQRAQKSDRVMSVLPGASGGKADAGRIGFEREHPAGTQFLIFPKSLRRFAGRRVVGIKFDLLEQPALAKVDAKAFTGRGRKRRTSKRGVAGAPASPARHDAAAGRKPVAPVAAAVPPKEAASDDSASAAGVEQTARRAGRISRRAAGNEAPLDAARLVREIRAAIKELEQGKAVAAHQRLQRAIDGA